MTDDFKPQFPHARLEARYRRLKTRIGKIYIGCFYLHGQPVKYTNRLFKTATEANDYSKIVLERYANLVNAYILTLIPTEA